MANNEIRLIETRLGPREVRLDKVIRFPRGLIGFDALREFTLLQIHENAPLLLLQNLERTSLGLLVADPYAFIPDYALHINDADQEVLKAENAGDLAVLVTAYIPQGKPEKTSLNLLGPILINHKERLGLQIPQTDGKSPPRVFISMHKAEAPPDKG
ncbi:MAG: flagellar assembly protein FliW [Desulfovibrio sp.]|jgi:flagellar assembly factor FliW|nr:flagellar assembly protein FliW [Desulfovibrio sp.]